MIIINGVVWHSLMPSLALVSAYRPISVTTAKVFSSFEKLQLTCFFLQEVFISGVYIRRTIQILKTAFGSSRKLLWQLSLINAIIILMDIAIMATEYYNLYLIECGLKVVIYSVKLKLEFAVLGQLIQFVQDRGQTASMSHSKATATRGTGFIELSGNHSKSQRGGVTELEAMPQTATIVVSHDRRVTATQGRSFQDADCDPDHIKVVTTVDVDRCDAGDDRSVDELCSDHQEFSNKARR